VVQDQLAQIVELDQRERLINKQLGSIQAEIEQLNKNLLDQEIYQDSLRFCDLVSRESDEQFYSKHRRLDKRRERIARKQMEKKNIEINS
jgi:phage-related minor tail protein